MEPTDPFDRAMARSHLHSPAVKTVASQEFSACLDAQSNVFLWNANNGLHTCIYPDIGRLLGGSCLTRRDRLVSKTADMEVLWLMEPVPKGFIEPQEGFYHQLEEPATVVEIVLGKIFIGALTEDGQVWIHELATNQGSSDVDDRPRWYHVSDLDIYYGMTKA